MARPRKVMKRVKLYVEVDMTEANLKALRPQLVATLQDLFHHQIVYVAVDSETI